ncbi:MAG: UDP-glucose 4-epimerase GalE [Bdellovibrionaceae bacterium]|nr:UDP-glucose 4-epimerase GalE [Pseudobdellovibrionaceae bacterium]
MKILVTGGAGYIGSVTVQKLREQKHDIVVYDNLSTGVREAVPQDVKFIFGDVRDRDLVARVMKDESIEAVVHFAAKLVVPESVEQPLEYYDVNVGGSLSLLEGARKAGVKAFVFSSTAAVYGNPPFVPVTEDVPVAPLNPYGASKAMVEQLLRDFEKAGGCRFVSLRYFNVAGATEDLSVGQRTKNATHLVKVASEAATGKRGGMSVFGTDYGTPDGTCVRDYIHVEDLADAHLLALHHLSRGGESAILNCGYGRGFSVKDVVATMQEVSGVSFPVTTSGCRAGDAGEIVADSSRLQKLFGWKPRRDDLRLICRTAFDWEKKLR